MPTGDELAFAYRYPFSEEAKEIISKANPAPNNLSHLRLAKARLEEAFEKGKISYHDTAYGQLDNVISYVYARLLVSALPTYLISRYADAEASRSVSAMNGESDSNILNLANELGVTFNFKAGTFYVDFATFLKNAPETPEYGLTNQRINGGFVDLDSNGAAGMLKPAIARKIRQGLPIPRKDIPKQTLEYAREIKLPKEKLPAGGTRTSAWVEKLLSNPIPDVRQRVVGLVLAPYLVNVKNMEVETAYKVIVEYIDKCKALDPNTQMTNAQIHYQCNYAKTKGMRPLSFQKAKELLSGVIDFDKV